MWNAISLVQDLNSCRRVHFRGTSKLFFDTLEKHYLNKKQTIEDSMID